MSEPMIDQLHQRVREIHARNEAIRVELTPGLSAEKPTYALLLALEIPLNEARLVMANAHINLIQSSVGRSGAEKYVGQRVVYISGSGQKYTAMITRLPENPWHSGCDDPTVSLEFRDGRGKLVRKKSVLPVAASLSKRQVWKWSDESNAPEPSDPGAPSSCSNL